MSSQRNDNHTDLTENDQEHWWDRSLSRRDAHRVGLSVAAIASLAGCDSSKVVDMDALAAQKKGGWDVGDAGKAFALPHATGQNSLGATDWQKYADPKALLAATTPQDPPTAGRSGGTGPRSCSAAPGHVPYPDVHFMPCSGSVKSVPVSDSNI